MHSLVAAADELGEPVARDDVGHLHGHIIVRADRTTRCDLSACRMPNSNETPSELFRALFRARVLRDAGNAVPLPLQLTTRGAGCTGCGCTGCCTVGFHNFNLRNFILKISNPKLLFYAVF